MHGSVPAVNWWVIFRDGNMWCEHIGGAVSHCHCVSSASKRWVCFDAEQEKSLNILRNDSILGPRWGSVETRYGQTYLPNTFLSAVGWVKAAANMAQSLSRMPAAKLLYSSVRMSVWSCAVKCTDGWLIQQSCDSSITAVTISLPPQFFTYSSPFHFCFCFSCSVLIFLAYNELCIDLSQNCVVCCHYMSSCVIHAWCLLQ